MAQPEQDGATAVATPESGSLENWDDERAGDVTASDSKPGPRSSPSPARSPETPRKQPFYFDLETVPDEERIEQFDLEPLPEAKPETESTHMPLLPSEFLDNTIDVIKSELRAFNPVEGYLELLENAERCASKPRKGVLDAINACRTAKTAHLGAIADRQKLLSTTPEFCKIVAIGWGRTDGHVRSLVVGQKWVNSDKEITERDILKFFWEAAYNTDTFIGFNVLHFDLPVIFVRSIILDVPATRTIDTSPFSSNRDVLDLYYRRFGSRGNTDKKRPGKLKSLAKLYGVDVPAGDVDGGDVLELWKSDPQKLGEYVRSDVAVTRDMHRKMMGFFVE